MHRADHVPPIPVRRVAALLVFDPPDSLPGIPPGQVRRMLPGEP